MTDQEQVSIDQCFHKDGYVIRADNDWKISVPLTSIVSRFHTLPIEVLGFAKQLCWVKIVVKRGATDPLWYVEFTNDSKEGQDLSILHQSPEFWQLVIKLCVETKSQRNITDLTKAHYAKKVETYTMNQILHLVNVIRGDLANQPKLVKQILNMVEKENLL